jgi:FtsP/CotA-like multicopper oxidase with cupredoxin domain
LGGSTVRFITKFEDFADEDFPYMYHCHILPHEDGGMMGQFIVKER